MQEMVFDQWEVSRRLDELTDLIEMGVSGTRLGLDALKHMPGPLPEVQAIGLMGHAGHSFSLHHAPGGK